MAVIASPAEIQRAPDLVGAFFEPTVPAVLEAAEVQSILYGHRYQLADTLSFLVDYLESDAELGNIQGGLADADRAAAIGAQRYDRRQHFLSTGSSFLGNIAVDIGPSRHAVIGQGTYEPRCGGMLTVVSAGEPRIAFGLYEPTDKDVKEGVGRADDQQWLQLLIAMKIESEKPHRHRQENFGVVNKHWKMY